jgi:hypothetical protein
VGDLNSKFEEAGNLITASDSGFRALLAISGGAGIQNMLTNQFDRTEGVLRAADSLRKLNAQFGGNLNILGQVAEQTFGISKEVAIKLVNLTKEQQAAIQQARRDALTMGSEGLNKAYTNVTNTVSAAWDRLKNVFGTMVQRIVTGPGVMSFLDRFGKIIDSWVNGIGNPNSGIGKFVNKLSDMVSKIFEWLDKLLQDIEPIANTVLSYIDKLAGGFDKGFWAGITNALGSIFTDILGPLITKAVTTALDAIPLAGAAILGGPVGAAAWVMRWLYKQLVGEEAPAKKQESDFKTQNAALAGMIGSELSKTMASIRKEESRMAGLKDTDIVVGRNGQFTLAGLERIELDKLEESATDLNNKLMDKNNENLSNLNTAINNLNAQLSRNGFSDRQISQVPQQNTVTVPPPAQPVSSVKPTQQAPARFSMSMA